MELKLRVVPALLEIPTLGATTVAELLDRTSL